jgi:hypothetical protein
MVLGFNIYQFQRTNPKKQIFFGYVKYVKINNDYEMELGKDCSSIQFGRQSQAGDNKKIPPAIKR